MLSPVSLCQLSSPLYAWTELKLLQTSSRNHVSPRNLKLRLFRQKMPSGVWLRVTALHYPGVPEQARTGRAREPKYLYQKGWDEEETGLESDPASQGGAGTRDKDSATGA